MQLRPEYSVKLA